MPQWSVRNQAWVATPRPKIERQTPYDVATSRLSSRFAATSAGPSEPQPLISPKSTRNHRWPPDAHELHNPSSPSKTSAAPIDTASPVHNPFLPLWKDAPPESLHKVASKSNVVANLWLKSQPLMEVAEPWAGTAKRRASYQMSVHKTYELDSDVVAHLRPFQRLRVLSTRSLPDGTERACIMLESNGKLLGWLTATTADGIANIHIYARPLYEVATPTKVREKFELTSKFVTQLEEGTKLHVVESRKLLEGTLRVCVMLVGNPWGMNAKCGPIGWITANRNEDGVRLIRETNVPHADSIPFRPRTASAFVGEHQRPKPARPFSTGLTDRRLAQQREADDDIDPRVSLTPRGSLSDEFNEASSSSRRTPKSERSGGSGGPQGRTPAGSRNSDSFHRSQKTLTSPTASNPTDAITFSGVEEGVPSSAVETPTTASFKMKKTAGQSAMKMNQASKTMKEEGKKSRVDELLPSGTIRKVANELFEKALDLETKAIRGRKPLTVQMGEALQKRKVVVADLMREWDPNGDGEISPMEFRQNVRKLLPTELHAGLVISEVDALFNDLDLDKSGALDVGEIKIALKRLQNEAALASVDKANMLLEVEALRKQAKEYEALASLTGELEGAKKAIEKANSKSVGVQIGAIAVKKGLKPGDIVKQWDVNGDGRLDKDEFRTCVLKLGVEGVRTTEIDELFSSFDTDNDGAITAEEVRVALKRLQNETEDMKHTLKRYGETIKELTDQVKTRQAEWKKLQEAEEVAQRERAERKEMEAQEKAQAKEAAKAARLAIIEEKKQAAAQEKAEFAARIEAKRRGGVKSPSKTAESPRTRRNSTEPSTDQDGSFSKTEKSQDGSFSKKAVEA